MITAPRGDEHFFKPIHEEEPVFIVGMGRSGTTLLRLMLNRHPELAVLSETSFAARVWERRWGFPMVNPVEPFRMRLLNSFIRRMHSEDMEDLEIDWAAYRRRVIKHPAHVNRFLSELGKMWAESQGKSRWGEKTPTHVYYLDLLKRMFPKMRAVNAVRDPRAVAISWVNANFSRVADPVAVTLEWKKSILMAERASRECDVPVMTVRYEDLVDDTEAVLRGLCDFCNLTYEDAMLDFHQDAGAHAPSQPWMESLSKPVNKQSVQRWRTQLGEEQVLSIEAIAAGALERYGYDAASDPGELARVRAIVQRIDRAYAGSAEADMRPIRTGVWVDDEAYLAMLETITEP